MNEKNLGDFLPKNGVAKNAEFTGNKGTQGLVEQEIRDISDIAPDSIIVAAQTIIGGSITHWVVASTSPLLEGPEVNIEQ